MTSCVCLQVRENGHVPRAASIECDLDSDASLQSVASTDSLRSTSSAGIITDDVMSRSPASVADVPSIECGSGAQMVPVSGVSQGPAA